MFLQGCEKYKLRSHATAKAVLPHSSPLGGIEWGGELWGKTDLLT